MSTNESFLEVLKGNICLSGGAIGADLQWGMNAGRDGQSVIHWSFHNHKSLAPTQEVVVLSEEQLLVADPYLKKAGVKLKKPFKEWFSDKTKSLLRRNYYQIAWASSLYAVASIKNGLVQGGTGWAVQMFLDRFEKESQFESIPAYVFDQNEEKWYQWIGSWKVIDSPPKPSGIWAGIGTRELNDSGKWAIRNLFGWYKE